MTALPSHKQILKVKSQNLNCNLICTQTKHRKLVQRPLNRGEPAAETYNSCSALGASSSYLLTYLLTYLYLPLCHCFCRSDHFPPLATICSITRFYVGLQISHVIGRNLFPCFLGLPLCLALSTSKVTHFHLNIVILFMSINYQ